MKYDDLMRIRARKQLGAAKKKGRVSLDTFEINNEVRIQDMTTRTWNIEGKIKAKRSADDEQDVSFIIELENGPESTRHMSHLRHNVTRYTPVTETKVRFSLPEDNNKQD